jgi:transcription elongation factor Elf1
MKALGNIRDVFKNIKHKKPTQIFCPRCASPNLTLSCSLDYWLTPQKYFCKDCGYIGAVFMELEKAEEQETEKEEKPA